MTVGLAIRYSVDIPAIKKEIEHLFRLMRRRKIEELDFDDIVQSIIMSHIHAEKV